LSAQLALRAAYPLNQAAPLRGCAPVVTAAAKNAAPAPKAMQLISQPVRGIACRYD